MAEPYHNPGVEEALLGRDLFGDPVKPKPQAPLADRFGVPPFTVLDARQGEWQERKRQWLALGIQSELGRGAQAQTQPIDAGGDGMCDRGDHHAGMAARGLAPRPGGSSATAEPFGKAYAGGDAWRSSSKATAAAFQPPDGEYEYPVEALQKASGTSIFDPMLCELAYRWFCPKGGAVLDPFAGGSVRGVVAGLMGMAYTGCELSAPQVAANAAQREAICKDARIWWHQGDSAQLLPALATMLPEHGGRPAHGYDMALSCPPYFDLEVYSDAPEDLSAMPWPHFCRAYRGIIEATCALLKPDAFAVWVVGDVRDKRTGLYRGLTSVTVSAFAGAGLGLYNEAVLVTSVGSLPIRSGKIFDAGRKLGKSHQNVYVFAKGDPKRAAQACVNAGVATG